MAAYLTEVIQMSDMQSPKGCGKNIGIPFMNNNLYSPKMSCLVILKGISKYHPAYHRSIFPSNLVKLKFLRSKSVGLYMWVNSLLYLLMQKIEKS